MSQQKVMILSGLPASGKSTYAKQLVDMFGWKRINKDDLRAMVDNSKWSEKNEKLIVKLRNDLLLRFLQDGYSVVIDDTNFAKTHVDTIKEICAGELVECEVLFFDTPLYECIERDAKREKQVGKKVIIKMYNQYLRAKVESVEFKDEQELPTCVLCDIDGTLAYSPDRNVYDYTKVDRDLPNKKLIEVLRRINLPVIIVSGREDNCQIETINWLIKNGVKCDYIVMRKSGDNRPDDIIKEEIYHEHIEGKFNILTVFDDRPRVIRMWKKLGLMVCDVSRQDPRVDF